MKTLAQIQTSLRIARSEQDQAKGALQSDKEMLQRDFGVSTKDAAAALDKQIQQEVIDLQTKRDAAWAAAAEKYPETFN